METIGTMVSHPDGNGNHSLKCPDCQAAFLSPIKKDENENILQVTCPSCGVSGEPKSFIYMAQKDEADKMARDFVNRKIKKLFPKNINIKL